MKTIIEPFRIKSVEPIRITTAEQRHRHLVEASYNLFRIAARHVMIDLLTDSGTGAMSSEQWAGIMRGDESYAGARSFYHFESVVRELTGFKTVIPVHQGRAAERILFSIVGGPGRVVIANSHFDTTRANVEYSGAEAVDLPVPEALDLRLLAPIELPVAALFERSLDDAVGECRACGAIACSPNVAFLQAGEVSRLNGAGLRVLPYTVNDAATMRTVIEWGAGGMFTDEPELLREVLA